MVLECIGSHGHALPGQTVWRAPGPCLSLEAGLMKIGHLVPSLPVLASTGALLLAAGCASSARPNVVLIVVDSLRADALGSYGHDPTASPRLDGLAREGLRFERAVATASWNLPSVSSLVTSTPPWVHGQGAPSSGTEEVRTLAEAFSEAGYRTAAFTEVAWPLLQRGFGTFQNTSFKDVYGSPESNSAATTLQAALDWIRDGGDDPFFLLVHTYEVHSYFLGKPRHHERARAAHSDYEGPFRDWAVRDTSKPAGPQVIEALMGANEEDLAYVRSLYEAAVAETDVEIGRFLDGLGVAGLADRTVVVVTSSNGEGFRPDLKRVHHGGRLHDDLLRVPLIVRWPGHLEPGVEEAAVTTLDVGPTLLALAGVPEEPLFSGRPLVAGGTGVLALGGPRFHVQRPDGEPVVAQEAAFQILPSGAREAATGVQLALYTDGVALIDTGDSAELYDLEADPEQEHDRSAEYADGVERLRKKVRQIAEQGAGEGGGPSAEELEQLRTLGYVQ